MRGQYFETETQELYLYTINTGEIYRARTVHYLENLKKKAAKGQYDPKKAAVGFEAIALLGARHYAKEFCSKETEHRNIFMPADRREAAKRMEEHYREEVLRGYEDINN